MGGVVSRHLELAVKPFKDAEVLLQACIQIPETWADDAVVLQRIGSQYVSVRRQRLKRGRVEPMRGSRIRDARVTSDDYTAKLRVVTGDVLQHRAQPPAAHEGILHFGGRAQEALALPERKIPTRRKIHAMERLVAILPLELVQVVCEIVEIINLRPLESIDVTPQEREAAAESPTGLT